MQAKRFMAGKWPIRIRIFTAQKYVSKYRITAQFIASFIITGYFPRILIRKVHSGARFARICIIVDHGHYRTILTIGLGREWTLQKSNRLDECHSI